MAEGRASRTAVLVCQGRAAAHGRLAASRFADPVAMSLLRDDERSAVDQVRDGRPPASWRQRVQYEAVRAGADLVVPRTVAIDDAVRARPAPQVVILGAGLDSRARRMPELAEVDVLEVDQPASDVYKQSRVVGREPRARSVRCRGRPRHGPAGRGAE